MDRVIYNCHAHIFTHENLPDGYFPFRLVAAIRNQYLRAGLSGIMKGIVPWTKNDKINRYAAFLKSAYRETQEGNLKQLMGYYPTGTRFVILPMDMAFMGAGSVVEDIDGQHAELARLSKKEDYKDILIPFAHIEPRRNNALDRLRTLVEDHGFKGVKIYPPLGYSPDHEVLMNRIYPYMAEKDIPLLSHCSPGTATSKALSPQAAHALADPDRYQTVMKAYPELRICLAHFGGSGEWQKHLDFPRNQAASTWLQKILEMIKSRAYPNLYTDISYTVFNLTENVPLLKMLLQNNDVLDKVLFGSDFYMAECEQYSEKRLSIDLRYALGEDLFWKIANENPKTYLGQ